MKICGLLLIIGVWGFVGGVHADWPRFHGPAGNGVGDGALPDTWSDTENIVWKADLPGPGASTPVIVGGKVFLTAGVGGAEDLVRHVLCLDAKTGKVLWDKTVETVLPEQAKIREDHGYTSATPVADGTHVYVFFGKSGVVCFDHAGNQKWKADVGSRLNGWGSAASLTLHGKMLLVNASVESSALYALDAATGKEIWKADGIKESWHAPVVAAGSPGKEQVVMAMLNELGGYDAANGTRLWSCKSGITWYMCPLPLVHEGVVYAVGGRSGTGGLAVKLGGSGDVTATHRLWTLDKGTNVPSPVIHNGLLFFAHEGRGTVHAVDLKTGETVASAQLEPNPGGIYASPVLVGGKILWLGRGGQAVITSADKDLKMLGSARLENGRGVFNASPAMSDGRLFLRSNKILYCIGKP
jgi:outer membrane protein assembly factor BamB